MEKYCRATRDNTGHFIVFSMITNIYNKKTKGPTLMELITATGKLFFLFFIYLFIFNIKLEMFGVCTMGDTAQINTIFKFLPHTCQHRCIDVFHCYNDSLPLGQRGHVAVVGQILGL
jgi:hypothetical protein